MRWRVRLGGMRNLAPSVQRYLWCIYIIALGLCAVEARAIVAQVRYWRAVPGDLAVVVLFTALAYACERAPLRISPTTIQSLSTAVCIAVILLFPLPIPLFVAVAAVGFAQGRIPLVKRAFNLAHTIILVGGSGFLLDLISSPSPPLPYTHILAATPRVALLLPVYYALDVGPILILQGLLEKLSPRQAWIRTYRRTLLPELATGVCGILAAVVWRAEPAYLPLFVVPVAAFHTAYRAIIEREERAVALRRRGEQLEAILATVKQLQVPGPDLLTALTEAAQKISGARVSGVYVRDAGEPLLLCLHASSPSAVSEPVLPRRRAAMLPGAGVRLEGEGPERVVLVPVEEDRSGVVSLLCLGDLSSEGEDYLGVLAILAAQGSVMLENRRLHERALARASEDSLTELLNHRSLQNRFDEELARSTRTSRPVSFLMVDLDDFGLINNAHGHPAGDAAIVAVAGALREGARASDVLGRYGGDEFALILPDTDLREAIEVAERIRAAIASLRVVTYAATIRVSSSIGVSTFPLHGRTREDLVRAADEASYAAKGAGKGRVARPEDAVLTLESDHRRLRDQLANANMATVEALAAAVDAKDGYTYGHSRRVSAYAAAIAYALGLPRTDVARLRLAGLLHDVGKIGIPDAILTKPGPLDADEYDVVKEHPVLGAQMLEAVPFLREILPAVRHHHERWDGAGYPNGLNQSAIPQDATIIMVADAFDAMTTSRTYRPGLPWREAHRRVLAGREAQFAPAIVDAFERALNDGTMREPANEPLA